MIHVLPFFWEQSSAQFLKLGYHEFKLSGGRRFILTYDLDGSIMYVPGKLTFGGFFPNDNLFVSRSEVFELLSLLTSSFPQVKTIIFKFPPEYFHPHIFNSQVEFMLRDSYRFYETNQHINLHQWTEQSLSTGNRKKLKMTYREGAVFKLAKIHEVDKLYSVIAANRFALGVNVSMNQSEMLQSIETFPEIYSLSYLELHGEVAAVSFTVDISPKIRYVLYWADNLKYRNYSPIVTLCNELILLAREDSIDILDLGISSVGGNLNLGLHRFKQNLGAISTRKYVVNLDNA